MQRSALSLRAALCSVVLLFAAAGADAAIYAVGSEPGCTHATIQQAVDATEANPGEDFIRIPHSQVWTEQAVVIDTDQVLWLEGFWADCNTLEVGQTVLDGAGGSASSVMRIDTGANAIVRMSWLTLRAGDPSILDGKGGGIHFSGSGRLELSNDLGVVNNQAASGGGIYAEGDDDQVRLVIGANVTIAGNTAIRDGGGVFINGMTVEMLEANSLIAFNHALGQAGAKGYGGGLAVRSTGARHGIAFISSPGVGTLGAIYGNDAKWGGGIAVSAGEDSENDADAELYLYSLDPEHPGAVRGNSASEGGGGIYLWPNQNLGSTEAYASAQLWRAEITDNIAPDGAAAYVDDSSDGIDDYIGGYLLFNDGTPPAGGLPCPQGSLCGRVSGNVAAHPGAEATDGALFYLDSSSLYATHGLLVSANSSGRLVDSDAGAAVHLEDIVIVNNTLDAGMFRIETGDYGYFDLDDSTIADNNFAGAEPTIVSSNRDHVRLLRSIIWQPGHAVLNSTILDVPDIQYMIANDPIDIAGEPLAIVADPRFIDPYNSDYRLRDYRLRAASPAIDFAPPVDGDDRDALGLPRDQRIAEVPRADPSQSRDIGAFERQTLQPLALNADFAGDTNLWLLPAGHTGNYGAANAPGSPDGSGSAQVTTESGAGRILGYLQCIHLPGPGVYALNASVLTSGAPGISNPTSLLWELRADGGEGCIDGAITTGGEHALGTGTTGGDWIRPANPAYIPVPASLWNPNTSLTVIMAEYANASNDDYNAYFDAITLEWSADGSDVIFADDFDP